MGVGALVGSGLSALEGQGLAGLQQLRAKATPGSGATSGVSGSGATRGSGSSTSSASSTQDIGTTFLSLLVQELQNQDPTAPLDSTQMVGQMISLNQLNQLTSINQTLTTAYPSKSTTSGSSSGSGGTTSHALTRGLSDQASPGGMTAAAMRLLQGGTPTVKPQVSTSVSLKSY